MVTPLRLPLEGKGSVMISRSSSMANNSALNGGPISVYRGDFVRRELQTQNEIDFY
jgi:hypothetical protein